MGQLERSRIYPGSVSFDGDGKLEHTIDTDLWWKPLSAPGTDPSVLGPTQMDRHDEDPFGDFPPPVYPLPMALDTFELYASCALLDGLNLQDPRSTSFFGGGWSARSYPLCALDTFESYPAGSLLEGLGECVQGFGGNWSARALSGLFAFDDLESYTPGDEVNGLNNNVGMGPWVGRSLNVPALTFDTFESYGSYEDLDGLSGGTGWSAPWVGGAPVEAFVQPRICAGSSDRRMALGNGTEVSRTLPFADNWNKIRIALRLQWREDPGQEMFNFAKLGVGVCNGSTNRFTSGSCNNFIGAVLGDWLTYYKWIEAEPPWFAAGILKAATKVGASVTYGSSDLIGLGGCAVSFGADTPAGEARPSRLMLFLDIEKGSPFYTVQVALHAYETPNPANPEVDVTLSDLRTYEQVEFLGPFPILLYHQGPEVSPQQLAVDEPLNGVLDTVTISLTHEFDLYNFKIEISDVDIIRFA